MIIDHKLFALPILLTLSACGVANTDINQEGWGSDSVDQRYRPSLNWIDNFSDAKVVTADGSLSEAIDACDEVAGGNKYCVVTVSDSTTGAAVDIFRSNTKIIGSNRTTPLIPSKNGTFIYIGENTQNVVIESLTLKGRHVGEDELFAIVVEGKKINNILIKSNMIFEFNSDENAHGIAVFGTGITEQEAITNVVIDNNTIHTMRTGSSESLVVNGNVSGWEITNNKIYDVNNIAIDAIGGEGVSTKLATDEHGRQLPGKFDAARNGFIEGNSVTNMSTKDNPAYGNDYTWAGAIYVDGGHHIQIKDNTVVNAPWAYDVGSENCLTSSHITLTGNTASRSYYGDLLLGGYAETGYLEDKNIDCNPNNTEDANEGHGYVRFVTVKDNFFNTLEPVDKDTSNALIQYRTTNSIVVGTSVKPSNESGNGVVTGDDNSIKTIE
ncbi:hypothetical protein [Leucothrix arctica]|uniref:Right handed beta helix domain-containing protein n=1 Tax=Leucothrix arctica TaxID=1481894 RepID=A0A317C659_9GAMM|nr:hypothetical protein [Leucothrix arctica]PWQ93691.1 hypothetical protein DKT75_18950 [Leucothrix arctica]